VAGAEEGRAASMRACSPGLRGLRTLAGAAERGEAAARRRRK
jgi:hypothetical protein